jgi:hypothetical protein
MSAAEALQAAQNAGVEIGIDGDDLSLKAASEPPAAILDELRRHKTEIIAMLRPGRDRWSAEDWRSYFEERAAVAEFDGGLLRTDAEDQKFECCIVELAVAVAGKKAWRRSFRYAGGAPCIATARNPSVSRKYKVQPIDMARCCAPPV